MTLSAPGLETGAIDACADGAGGAFVAWSATEPLGTYLRHLDAFGHEAFAAGPMLFDSLLGSPQQLVPDGAGGVIVLAAKSTPASSEQVFCLHRLAPGGQLLWTTAFWHGSPSFSQPGMMLISDTAGSSFLLAWLDDSSPTSTLRAQRIDMQGRLIWTVTGAVTASSKNGIQIGSSYWRPEGCLVPDGKGGAWAAFSNRTRPSALRVQHLADDGARQWPDTGLVVLAGPPELKCWSVTADGAGGLYLSWHGGWGTEWFGNDGVQRIREDGSLAFGPNGLTMPGWGLDREFPCLGDQSNGHVMVAWQHLEDWGFWGTRVQMLDSTGTWLWPGDGVPTGRDLGAWMGAQVFTSPDGDATVIVELRTTWTPVDLQVVRAAQRFSAMGQRLWSEPPPAWLVPSTDQWFGSSSPASVPTNDGGVIFFWCYADSGMGMDPYAYQLRAQHLDAYGRFGQTVPRLVSVCDVPNDLGGAVEVRWQASSLESDSTMATVGYEVLRTQPDGSGGTALIVVASNDAVGDSEYVAHVPTLADSTSPASAPTVIRVRAHDAFGREWLSPASSGTSFANSPPLAVSLLATSTLSLSAPEPSPASSSTRIRYTLPTAGAVTLDLIDIAGRRVRVLTDGPGTAGPHAVSLDLTDDSGHRLPAGLYFVRLTVPGRTLTRRLIALL